MQGLRQASAFHTLKLLFWSRLRDSEIVWSSCLRQIIYALILILHVVSSCETHLIASSCSMRFRRDFWWWSRPTAVDGGGTHVLWSGRASGIQGHEDKRGKSSNGAETCLEMDWNDIVAYLEDQAFARLKETCWKTMIIRGFARRHRQLQGYFRCSRHSKIAWFLQCRVSPRTDVREKHHLCRFFNAQVSLTLRSSAKLRK